MIRSRNMMRWLGSDGPAILCAVLLLLGATRSRLSLPRPADADAYHDAVRAAAATIPLRTGNWIAEDVAVPTEAVDQLHPNVMISRRYHNGATGASASLLLVQSRDVRYIAPHYPPVCYPGAGLTLTSQTVVPVRLGRVSVNATRYTFESNAFGRGGLQVDNFMVLPDGTFQRDMDGMERRIGSEQRYFGAAQVQVVHGDNRVESEETAETEAILAAYQPVIDAISHGVRK